MKKMIMVLALMFSADSFAAVLYDSGVYGKVGCDDNKECHYIYAGGIVFPGVTVNISTLDESFSAAVVTDAEGVYKLPAAPGTYSVSIDQSSLKLHFLGTSVRVVRCGNVTGIDPGSGSPVTPFNFIEFEGEG